MPDLTRITTASELLSLLRRYDSKTGLTTSTGEMSWMELVHESVNRAETLRQKGIGGLIGLFGSPTWTIRRIFTVWALGATPVILNTHLTLEAAGTLCRRIGCRSLFLDDRQELLEVIHDSADDGVKRAEKHKVREREHWATIIFTAGSTGEPKACVHSFSNHIFSALGANENMPLTPHDRWLLSLPLYHVGGIAVIFRALAAGASVVIPPEPDLQNCLDFAQPTHLSLVRTQLHRLLREQKSTEWLRRFRAVLLGGSDFPEPLLRCAAEEGIPIHTSYGSTEMSSQITATPPQASLQELLTAGRLLRHRRLHITADGEIMVSGRTLFLGYREGDALVRPERDGWFPTGDLGCLDENGNLIVKGRKDNLFISAGENISPEEIERCILLLPDAAEAVVVPIPDQEYGFLPAAFIRTHSGASARKIDLTPLRRVLPGLKIPRRVWDLPKEAESRVKPSRPSLRRLAEQLMIHDKRE